MKYLATLALLIASAAAGAAPTRPMPARNDPSNPWRWTDEDGGYWWRWKVPSALDEVNAARARRGLLSYTEDPALTTAAKGAAEYRAANRIAGHTANDFAFLPAGATASAAGCAAWEPSWGWGSCCTYESYRYAGAAWKTGADGRRYMHLFVR
jgi:hypothetical protein